MNSVYTQRKRLLLYHGLMTLVLMLNNTHSEHYATFIVYTLRFRITVFGPIAIFSTHDRHCRAKPAGTTHARTYDPELDPDTDYHYRLVVYSVFVLLIRRFAYNAKKMFFYDFTALLV